MTNHQKIVFGFFIGIISLLIPSLLQAQIPNFPGLPAIDTANKDNIQLLQSDTGTFIINNDQTLNILQGDVVFEHKGDMFYCDSARINLSTMQAWAYGNVKVQQTDGTVAYADRMYYNGRSKEVEMRKNVELSSGDDNLWADFIDYNLNTQIGKYWNNGTLQSGSTVVTSKSAVYNAKTNQARFKGDVNVIDPEYEVVSSDLGYNTKTRFVNFYGPSIITNDSSTLYTKEGTYDAEKEVAVFKNRSSIQNQGQYMEADKLTYNRLNGLGIGTGNVIIVDSVRNLNLFSEYATMNELTKQVMATQDPLLKMYKDDNVMYMRADTFFSEPVSNLKPDGTMNAQDSILQALDLLQRAVRTGQLLDSTTIQSLDSLYEQQKSDSVQQKNEEILDNAFLNDTLDYRTIIINADTPTKESIIDSINITTLADTAIDTVQDEKIYEYVYEGKDVLVSNAEFQEPPDTSEYRYFIAYHNVMVYSDSAQAKADSLIYSQRDSLLTLYYDPVVWTRDGQVSGDVIFAKVDSNNIQWVKIPQNGIMINQSTTANKVMFDQLQGNTLWAYFTNNEIDSLTVLGNAQSIYYLTDDNDAYIGASEASAMNINITFMPDTTNNKRQIEKITYIKDFENTLSPMGKIQPSNLRLSRFNWRIEERPETFEEFIEYYEKKDEESTEIKNSVKKELQAKEDDNRP